MALPKRVRALLQNLALMGASILFSCILLEGGYRLYLASTPRQPVDSANFATYSSNFWSYDRDFGFNYVSNGSVDLSLLVGGTPRRCLSLIADADGNPGRPHPIASPRQRVFFFGDSMTFYQYDGLAWPAVFQDLINARGGEMEITNFARDGTGVLQMIDSAAAVLRRGQRPDLIVIAFISDDLARKRFWRQSYQRPDGSIDVFTSIDPDMTFAPGTYVRATLIHPAATKDWCQRLQQFQDRNDPTLSELRAAYERASHSDSVRAGDIVSLAAFDRSYLLDHLWYRNPHHVSRVMDIWTQISDYARDPQFVRNIDLLKTSGVPIVLAWLPQYEELSSGARKLTPQTAGLRDSLVRLSGFPLLDLLQPAPLKTADEYFNVPFDAHPSRKGFDLYAQRLIEALKMREHTSANTP